MEDDPYAHLSDAAREKCIRMMRKTLARKPRSKKTRDYVKTLSGSALMPEYQARAPMPSRKAILGAIKVTQIVRAPRRDRVAPFARNRLHTFVPDKNCRKGFRQRHNVRPSSTVRNPEAARALRDIIAKAQGNLCALCGGELPKPIHRASVDHTIPINLGGRDELGNLVVAHKECNTEKANDIPTGCEMVWLLMVNAKLGASPVVF